MSTATTKRPVAAATTSLTLLAASAFGLSMTSSAVDAISYIDNPAAYIRNLTEMNEFSTSTSMALAYEKPFEPRQNVKFAALNMFGEMRSSTLEEKELYEDMLARISRPIDVDIFAL